MPVPDDERRESDDGWIAHVTADNLLLIKSATDILPADSPPGEAEIQIYTYVASPEASYVEVENQGAYKDISPGGTLVWTVRWYLRALPEGLVAAPGSAELAAFVARTLE